MSEAEFPCLVSDTRTCSPIASENLVFIIGSGSPEFTSDLETIKEVLKGFGFEGYFALLSEKEKGLDAFCDKICSKILNSVFCVLMLNDPIILNYIDKESMEEKVLRAPRANVYYESGIAIALRKKVIPVMRQGTKLPFDIQNLDVILYDNLTDLKKRLIRSVRETLSKERGERIVKMPRIGLLLVDEEGNASETITAQPVITKVKYIERKEAFQRLNYPFEFARRVTELMQQFAPQREKDLVPIGIEIWNDGERPAQNILVFLEFPEDCELLEKSEAIGGIVASLPDLDRSKDGLYVDEQHKNTAKAWLNRLGNDRMTRAFNKIYVRFKTEKEKEYKLSATVIQDNYPATDYEFAIVVKPEIVEETRYKTPES